MTTQRAAYGRLAPSVAAPGWWVVCARELTDMWIGGKALILLFLFCTVQAVLTYLKVSDVLDLTPPVEMVYLTMGNAIAFGLFMSVILAADTISGERERATLEGLLLTPTSRTQIVVGKFLAAGSPWAAALAVTVPFLVAFSPGDEVLGPALLWGAMMGTLLAASFIALGMFVSSWCDSNKTSLFVSLVLYFAFLVPTMLPGTAHAGKFGQFFKWINPIESNDHFLEKIIVNNRTPGQFAIWLTSPVLFAVVVFALLFLYAGPRLRLDVGKTGAILRLPFLGK